MARYFFHSTTGRTSRTLRALSLRALKDARDAAVVFMGKKLKDLDGNFWPEGLWSIPADETDATVCTIRVTGDQPAI